jgi:hypothetical protein
MLQFFLAVLVGLSCITASLVPPQDPQQDERSLVELQHALVKAWISADRATIERIIAPEWRSTTPDGQVTDRATVLAEVFEKGVDKIRRLEIDDIRVRVFGDAAVVTGRTQASGTSPAHPMTWSFGSPTHSCEWGDGKPLPVTPASRLAGKSIGRGLRRSVVSCAPFSSRKPWS